MLGFGIIKNTFFQQQPTQTLNPKPNELIGYTVGFEGVALGIKMSRDVVAQY